MRSAWTILALITAFIAVGALTFGPQVVAGPQAAGETRDETQKPKKENIAAEIRSVEMKIPLSELKLAQARMESDAGKGAAQSALRHAQEDLAIARAKLAQYREFDSRRQIEESRLALRASKDRAQEAAEELAQIELMYKDQDLDDRTAEFVIQRGKRNAERAAARIALEEMALETLEKHEVPREIRQHSLDVARKESAVEAAERALESANLKGRISVTSAELELEELKQKLTRLRSNR